MRRLWQRDATRAWLAFFGAPLLGVGAMAGLASLGRFGDRVVLADSTNWSDLLSAAGLVGGGLMGCWLLLRPMGRPWFADAAEPPGFRFPGPVLGGVALIGAPLLLLAGELVRIRFYFYYPSQLAAYEAHPGLMTTSYSLYALGLLACWPAFLTATRLIGVRQPGWATSAGVMALTGLLVRMFHEGVNYLSFQMVSETGLSATLAAVKASYTHWYVFYPLVFTDNLAWVLLAIGAYRARRLGPLQCLGLSVMMAHSSGVLKGSSIASIVETLGICVALVPLGIAVLAQDRLSRSQWIVGSLSAGFLLVVSGYQLATMTTR
jgi:hypothetical protein